VGEKGREERGIEWSGIKKGQRINGRGGKRREGICTLHPSSPDFGYGPLKF